MVWKDPAIQTRSDGVPLLPPIDRPHIVTLKGGARVEVMEGVSSHYGARVWGSAYALSEYLEQLPMKGARIVELGAGPGLVGLVAAALGAKVTLTDHVDRVLELLAQNIKRNQDVVKQGHGHANVLPLHWGHPMHIEAIRLGGGVDYILAADVMYATGAHSMLAST